MTDDAMMSHMLGTRPLHGSLTHWSEPTLWLPPAAVVVSSLGFLALSSRGGPRGAALVPAILLLLGLVAVGARRPGPILVLMLAFVPLQVALLSAAYAAGTPAGIVRGLGFLKEAGVAALVLAALGGHRSPGSSRGPLPWAVATLGLTTLFFVIPFLAAGVLYDVPFAARALGWRTDCLGLVALVALARTDLEDKWRKRAVGAVVLCGVVLGLGALWNGLLPQSFDAFSQNVLHVRRFQADVLSAGSGAGSVLVESSDAGSVTYRAGSFLYNPLTASFYLLLPFAVLASRLSHRVRPLDALAFALVTAGLLLTGTRSSILAAIVGGLVLLASVRRAAGGARLAAVSLVLVALIFGTLGSSFRTRLNAASAGTDVSAQQHVLLSTRALEDVAGNPLGRGIGTSPAIGARFDVAGRVTSEDAYLQVGIETGVLGLALFVCTLASAIALGWRRRMTMVGSTIMVGGTALAVSGLFLHTWEDFSVSLTYWCLVGLCLGDGAAVDPRSAPSDVAV